MDSLINIGLYLAYFALFIAVASLIVFPIVTMLKGNLKNVRGTFLGIAVLVAVVILAYIISPADQGIFYTKMNISPGTSKLIGAGLLTTYIIFAAFILITLYTMIIKWFK